MSRINRRKSISMKEISLTATNMALADCMSLVVPISMAIGNTINQVILNIKIARNFIYYEADGNRWKLLNFPQLQLS